MDSKTEFNGIGGLRTHIGIVPMCGTFLPDDFGLNSPALGLFLQRPQRMRASTMVNLSLTVPLQSDLSRDGTGERAGSRKKKPTA
jgi:hypothetical protein